MGDEAEFQPLTHEILSECLSELKHVVDGGFAFTRLDCSNKELTNLGNKVEDYKQLQHIVLSQNKLNDISALTKLPHLLTLQVDNNEVASLACMAEAELPWCQRLNLSSNKLEAVPSLSALVRLRFLTLATNAITSLEGFAGHQALEELELQENQLASLVGMGQLMVLKKLNVSSNQLTSLQGLDAPCLDSLDASSNQLASLEYIGGAPALTDLNLSSNQFDAEDPQLPELRLLGSDTPGLRSLLLSGTPLADTYGDSIKVEMLVCAPQLLRVEDEDVTQEDIDASKERAKELVELKLQKEQEEAEERERLEREAAEAEAEGEGEAEGGDDEGEGES